MKYNKIDLNEKLFGDDFIVYNWKEDENNIVIYLKAVSHDDICPACGSPVHDLHNTYHRKIQAYPIRSKQTYLDVIAYKYNCTNSECERKVIMQNLPFVSPSQRRTDELNCLILAISIFLSNEGASKVLKLLGIEISNDSIKRLLDKIIIEDDPDIEQIGIDDVAIRKGQTYATAVYDMEDHHLIALLNGRDKAVVKEWLESHRKIKIASRDRASAYASALNEILPECIQVADRFHLLQNLIDRMKDIFRKELPEMIFIRDSQILDVEPKKMDVLKIGTDDKELDKLHYDNSDVIDENGDIIGFDKSSSDKSNKQHMKHTVNRKKKQQLIREIQQRWRELDKKSYKTIMSEFHISQVTAKKYIHMSDDDIQLLDNPTVYRPKNKPTNDYVNIIYKMYKDGIKPEVIYSYICKSGYSGTRHALDSHIKRIIKNNFNTNLPMKWYLKSEYPKDITIIKRSEVLKYITTKNKKKAKSRKVGENIALIEKKYPLIISLKEIYDSFHEILMGDDPDRLTEFVQKYRDSEMKGFIEGIEKDIAPIKNAISLPYSSGFVEGNNNKFKLIKRILYGRSNLVNLFRKCYVPFLMNNTEFNLSDLLKSKDSTTFHAV